MQENLIKFNSKIEKSYKISIIVKKIKEMKIPMKAMSLEKIMEFLKIDKGKIFFKFSNF